MYGCVVLTVLCVLSLGPNISPSHYHFLKAFLCCIKLVWNGLSILFCSYFCVKADTHLAFNAWMNPHFSYAQSLCHLFLSLFFLFPNSKLMAITSSPLTLLSVCLFVTISHSFTVLFSFVLCFSLSFCLRSLLCIHTNWDLVLI